MATQGLLGAVVRAKGPLISRCNPIAPLTPGLGAFRRPLTMGMLRPTHQLLKQRPKRGKKKKKAKKVAFDFQARLERFLAGKSIEKVPLKPTVTTPGVDMRKLYRVYPKQMPDFKTYGQEGYRMTGLNYFKGQPDIVIQPRSHYPPELFDLCAEVPTSVRNSTNKRATKKLKKLLTKKYEESVVHDYNNQIQYLEPIIGRRRRWRRRIRAVKDDDPYAMAEEASENVASSRWGHAWKDVAEGRLNANEVKTMNRFKSYMDHTKSLHHGPPKRRLIETFGRVRLRNSFRPK